MRLLEGIRKKLAALLRESSNPIPKSEVEDSVEGRGSSGRPVPLEVDVPEAE